ncbi:MAG TPA: NAD-dependent epimerase/dehydratase family protein [Steroidobacteraceae bacterium]|nr:NAD-dependent epimerase/dehydratase family protein [Steroidobacteraceae bacterium]
MKRVLVFGGDTGVVATRVANALTELEWAHPLFADTRRPAMLNAHVEHVPFIITSPQAMMDAMRDVDAVISCVENNPDLIRQSATALFNAAQRFPEKRVVLFSSMAVYGGQEGVLDESAALNAVDDYAAARIDAESMAANSNTVCLRGGVEYGPGSARWSGLIARLLMSKRLGDLGAAGDGYCNLLFMDDLVDAMIKSLQLTGMQHQVFNLCSSERITWNEYLIRYGVALGAVPVKRISRRCLKFETRLAIPLKIAELILGQSNAARLHVPAAISPAMIRTFNQRILMNTSKAEHLLGMKWTPLQTGLQTAAEWVRDAV